MKDYYCDLHIHSCLSPCGDDEMTPSDIVGMARLNGLDIIALTDHNSALNVPAAVKAGARTGLTVIPGMELETSEEVHIILLFPSVEAALECGKAVDSARFKIKNRTDIYGRQVIADEFDREIGEVEDLLLTSSSIGVYDAVAFAARYGGIAYPAHVDKPANGIIQILGALDAGMGFTAAEVSPRATTEITDKLSGDGYKVVYGSDAHYLADISDPCERNRIVLEQPSAECLINYLRKKSIFT